MANKNKKSLNLLKRKALKAKESSLTVAVCVEDYHSSLLKPPFYLVTHPIHHLNKSTGIVSTNENRNLQMKIYKNEGGSQTFHEPIYPSKPVLHKNHQYIENYSQPKQIRN